MTSHLPTPAFLVPVVPASWEHLEDPDPEEMPFVLLRLSADVVRAWLTLWDELEEDAGPSGTSPLRSVELDEPLSPLKALSLSERRKPRWQSYLRGLSEAEQGALRHALRCGSFYAHEAQYLLPSLADALETSGLLEPFGSVGRVAGEMRATYPDFSLAPSGPDRYGSLTLPKLLTAEMHVCAPSRVPGCWHSLASREPRSALNWLKPDAPRDVARFLGPEDLTSVLAHDSPSVRSWALEALGQLDAPAGSATS